VARLLRFEGDLRNFTVVCPAGGDPLRALRASAVEENHARVLRASLMERISDPLMIVVVSAAGERDARAGGKSTCVSASFLAFRKSRLSIIAGVRAR